MRSKSRIKRWGNSFGVIIPREIVEKEGLEEGEEVEISVRKPTDIKQLFGKYPFKNIQLQKERMRKGWD
ncbi:MAG: AbrB/MazE/SpoVT family DNA-binding domain-containing protein [Nitrososphaerales archaeon]